jgi:hypothetical protein
LRCREASHKREQLARALEHADDQDGKKKQGGTERAIAKATPLLLNPQQGKEPSRDGAYPTGGDYITKEGRRLVLLPIRPL